MNEDEKIAYLLSKAVKQLRWAARNLAMTYNIIKPDSWPRKDEGDPNQMDLLDMVDEIEDNDPNWKQEKMR